MIIYSKRLKNCGRTECTRYIRRYRHIREVKKKKKERSCSTRAVRRNGFQRAKNFSINERQACAREARARKVQKTGRTP